MQQTTQHALTYIQSVLENRPISAAAELRAIERIAEVPAWINHAAHFTEVRLSSGYQFILIEPHSEMAADRLLALYRVTQSAVSLPLILVTDQQRHQVRSALMRAHLGLVRSGHYLFAPQFGIHRKDSPQQKIERANGSAEAGPSQQAHALLLPQEMVFLSAAVIYPSLRKTPSLTAFVEEFTRIQAESTGLAISAEKALGRVSRAISHFQKRDLATIQRTGKEMSITFAAPEVLWAHLCRDSQPLVRQIYPVFTDLEVLASFPESALSALSRYSDLLPPKTPTFAMSRTEWTSWTAKGANYRAPEPTAYVEVWKTNPRYLQTEGTVNPLLLALNCRRDPDERVRIAIREMLENLHVSADPLWVL